MQVPLLDLKPQYEPLATEIQAAIARLCASQHFILGPAVKELEASLAAYCQCQYGIGVSSGTDALLLALMALGIGAGDAVITSTFTFFATAGTIARTGARPLFCDIDPLTFNLDPAATQVGVCVAPVSTGLPPAYPVRDLLRDENWTWRIGRNYVKLGPGQSHVLRIGS